MADKQPTVEGKAKLADEAKKQAPETNRDDEAKKKAPATDREGEEDRLGKLADSETRRVSADSDAQFIKDTVDAVRDSFTWVNDAAQQQIGDLKAEIEKEDEPPFAEQLLERGLDIALGAGAGAAGEFLSGILHANTGHGGHERKEGHVAEAKAEAGKEFLKIVFEEGINAGIEAGRSKLEGHGEDSTEAFIASQKEGVRAMHMENQKRFTFKGRHEITTRAQAEALEATLTRDNVEKAGALQRDATRDAWVSYLAQTKFGEGRAGRTNMLTQERRDFINKDAPHHVPDEAPNIGEAFMGRSPGVLEVVASLPAIENGVMEGAPRVTLAFLNGVNGHIRKEYANKPLAESRIPRQIAAQVDGDQPNFTINLDEAGQPSNLTHAQGAWLRARASVEDRGNVNRDEYQQKSAGLALLLAELTPREIKGKM